MVRSATKEDEAIGEPCSPLERRFAATEPDRHGPRRLRHECGSVDPIEAAREVDNRFREQPAKQLDLLLLACASRTKVLTQGFVLDLAPADANAQSKPTSGQQVDIGGLARHECRLALRQDQDPGRKPDALGDASQISEHHERIMKRILLRVRPRERRRSVGVDGTQHMVVGKEVIETQILDCPPNPSNCDWIASKLDLGVHDADLHCPPCHTNPDYQDGVGVRTADIHCRRLAIGSSTIRPQSAVRTPFALPR